jgi:CubicO group peptidase (beta-lactamase class C family)
MNRARFILGIVIVITAILSGCHSPSVQTRTEPDYWPTAGWRTTTPEEQGMDSGMLAQMVDSIQEEQLPLHSLLIVRNGYLVSEIYPYPYSADQVHIVQSVTKSVLGALVGIAIDQGYLKNVQ